MVIVFLAPLGDDITLQQFLLGDCNIHVSEASEEFLNKP
jgi:hypothetical protein